MKKILLFIVINIVLTNAQLYTIYDINGNNIGSFNEELNKYTLTQFVNNHHGSILVKKIKNGSTTQIINSSKIQHNFFQSKLDVPNVNINQDSLSNDFWLEVEKNETIKICLNKRVYIWETSLNANIFSDSCLAIQAPTLIEVDTLKIYFSPEKDQFQIIKVATGMKYLNFQKKEVLLGYNTYKENDAELYWDDESHEEEDPERLVSFTGAYLVDKYPITNCEFIQQMWDSISMQPSFENSMFQEFAEQWALRKRNNKRNENCISKDTAACTIFLLQAMKYANLRSIHEGLKPCYNFSKIKANEQGIISKGTYIIGNFDYNNIEDDFIKVSIDSSSDGYRLPFYDEWMIFARGGDKEKNAPWGNSSVPFEETTKYAKFASGRKNYFETEPVGQLQPNGYGIYDIFGLVQEHVLFEERNPFTFLKGRPSCLKGGDNHVKKTHKINSFDLAPYWKRINYGYYAANYNGGMPAGFRLIRKLK